MIAWLLALVLVLVGTQAWAAPAISVSPSSVEVGTAVTATWSGITAPVATDWIGTYTPAAANTAYQTNWVYVNCTQVATSAAASGSCSISTGSLAAGTYELRLLIADGFTSVATSSTFTVTASLPTPTRYITNDGLTSGSCATSGTACRMDYALQTWAAADEVFQMNCGTYQGVNNLLNLGTKIPGVSGTSGHPITIQAETDGCVFIDGQFAGETPFWTHNNSYWTLQGFDVGNGIDGVVFLGGGSNLIVRRICASNIRTPIPGQNAHIWATAGATYDNSPINSLFEDICLFGTGRTSFTEYAVKSGQNIYRRFWVRAEGNPPRPDSGFSGSPLCPHFPTVQWNYVEGAVGTQTAIFENWITIYDPEQYNLSTWGSWSACPGAFPTFAGMSQRDGGSGLYKIFGTISFGYGATDGRSEFTAANQTQLRNADAWTSIAQYPNQITDYFLDARSQSSTGIPFYLGCIEFGNGSLCNSNTVNRITSIKRTGGPASTFNHAPSQSNINECESLSSCPNFYTGTVGSTSGARNCYEYIDGVLDTARPLWPWRMDDRIKAALARAKAAGTGGSDLAGTAGSGYAANTVTSEIVSRYGSVPTACLREAVFTPSFPVATDFPSVSVRDDFDRVDAGTLGGGFTELTSDVFSIASNAAAAPASGFARAIYTDTKLQVDHEVYATWPTVQSCCGYMTILSFAGTTNLSANSQYRYEVNRQSSGNAMVKVVKIDSGGNSITIIPEVDLGADIADTNSFGVRVSGTTLSIYWKWTDGIWYRVGQVTDPTLSTLPSSGVYGGIAGVVRTTINDFGAGPFVDQPTQEPPSPPSSSGSGRFGTTFPGVR